MPKITNIVCNTFAEINEQAFLTKVFVLLKNICLTSQVYFILKNDIT